jgi:hypothetical protein
MLDAIEAGIAVPLDLERAAKVLEELLRRTRDDDPLAVAALQMPDGAKYWLRLPVRGVTSPVSAYAPSPLACACTSTSSSDTSMRCPSPVWSRTRNAASTPVHTVSDVITSMSGTVTRTGDPSGCR